MNKQFLLSIVLAIGIVAAAIWVADHSLKTKSPESAAEVQEYRSVGEVRPSSNIVPQSPDSTASSMDANPSSASSSSISKCIVAGKVVYSNDSCPDGAKSDSVALHDSAGIVSPPKENLAELTAKRKAGERMYALQVQQQVTSLAQSSGFECGELEKRIAHLDAMARQSQPGSVQDWIKDERKAVRDRQFAIHC